jgi:TRAP-type C4-dicarboxylate transport system permease small subunit
MKKFKQIFYPLYLIATIAVGYLAITGLGDPSAKTEWFMANFAPARQATWILLVLFMLAAFMLVEIIIENIQIRRLKNQVDDQEEAILRLKAKLFDKGENEPTDEEDEYK